jgi:hypothetical protein
MFGWEYKQWSEKSKSFVKKISSSAPSLVGNQNGYATQSESEAERRD